uniref:Uncharacterized protein n=1 Tax=Trichuris muris TaxID=70415 RepID=A0A5S6QMC1_TRIMR
MPRRSRSVRSISSPTVPINQASPSLNNGSLPNSEVSRICDLLTNLTEKLDRLSVGSSLNINHTAHQTTQSSLQQPIKEGSQTSMPEEKKDLSNHASIQVDKSWFPLETPSSRSINMQAPNPWLQKLIPAASIEIFDGDPRSWPRFIASFKSIVHEALQSDVDRLAVLSQLLSPRLREGFAVLLTTPTMYRQVLEELQQIYGDPVATVQSHANALITVEPLSSESLSELERFYLQVNGPVSVLEINGRSRELNSMILVSQLSSKLTKGLREKWAHQIHSWSPEAISLRRFVERLKDLVIERRFLVTHKFRPDYRP